MVVVVVAAVVVVVVAAALVVVFAALVFVYVSLDLGCGIVHSPIDRSKFPPSRSSHHHRIDAGGHCQNENPKHENHRREAGISRRRRRPPPRHQDGRLLQPLEGLHPLLLPTGTAHRTHVYLLGADE